MPTPAVQKPRFCSSGSVCPVLVAVDSSMVTWAAANLQPAARLQQGVDLHAVDPVAHAQQRGGPHRGDAGAASGHHADEGELRAAAEEQQAQCHGLPEVQPGRDGQGPEGHAVESGGDADGQSHPHGRGLQELHRRRSRGCQAPGPAMSGACSGSRRVYPALAGGRRPGRRPCAARPRARPAKSVNMAVTQPAAARRVAGIRSPTAAADLQQAARGNPLLPGQHGSGAVGPLAGIVAAEEVRHHRAEELRFPEVLSGAGQQQCAEASRGKRLGGPAGPARMAWINSITATDRAGTLPWREGSSLPSSAGVVRPDPPKSSE